MAISVQAQLNGKAANTDPTVKTVSVPVSCGSGTTIVMGVAIAAAGITVSTITDNVGNTYTKKASTTASGEFDYTNGHYTKSAAFHSPMDVEIWTATSTGTVTSVTVTLTSGCTFIAEALTFGGVTSIGATSTSAVTLTNTPKSKLTTTAANSYVVSFFATDVDSNYTLGGDGSSMVRYMSVANKDHNLTLIGGFVAVAVASARTIAVVPGATTITQAGAKIGTPAPHAIAAIELKA